MGRLREYIRSREWDNVETMNVQVLARGSDSEIREAHDLRFIGARRPEVESRLDDLFLTAYTVVRVKESEKHVDILLKLPD